MEESEESKSKNPSKKRKSKGKTNNLELSDARRESHKIIEQKRRQKINEKINELRELLNYPDGSQNKAVVLQAAVENIKNLKVVCSKLLAHHKQLQEEYMHLLGENDRLRKLSGANPSQTTDANTNISTEKEEVDGNLKPSLATSTNFKVSQPDLTNLRLPLRTVPPGENSNFYQEDNQMPAMLSQFHMFPIRGTTPMNAQIHSIPIPSHPSTLQTMPTMPSMPSATTTTTTMLPSGFSANVPVYNPEGSSTNNVVIASSSINGDNTSTEGESNGSITRLLYEQR